MKAAVLADQTPYVGGAEIDQDILLRAAPADVELVAIAPDAEADAILAADVALVFNCVSYTPAVIEALSLVPVVKRWADMGSHVDAELRAWLVDYAAASIYCSPLHYERFPRPAADATLLPSPIDVDHFRPPRQHRRNGKRAGAVSLAAWQNPGKGARALADYAANVEPVDVYGPGFFRPAGEGIIDRGVVEHDHVAETLWAYERFVFLPWMVEPFGRAVAEAHVAGCELVVNRNIGALDWLEKPAAMASAAESYWEEVGNVTS